MRRGDKVKIRVRLIVIDSSDRDQQQDRHADHDSHCEPQSHRSSCAIVSRGRAVGRKTPRQAVAVGSAKADSEKSSE
jgi:hypothetical protein